MQDELGTPGAVVGSVVMACLFGGLALAIYPGWHVIGAHVPPIQWSDFIDAAAALGSCAAAVIALWIALRQSSKEARQDMEVARLHASSMIAGLQRTLDQVSSANARMAFAEMNRLRSDFSIVRKRLDSLAKRPSIDELKALAPLPNQCASRIARAFDHVALARERLTEFFSFSENYFEQLLMAKNCRADVQSSLQQAMYLLRAALPEVEKAANAGSPLPNPEELFGSWEHSNF